MKSVTRSLLAGLAVVAGVASASAADLGRGGSIKDGGYEAMPAAARPALFYLRSDFTFSHNDFGSITEPPNYTYSEARLGNNRGLGLGLGYYFSPNVRGDLTLDWMGNASAYGSIKDGKATVQGERQFGMKSMVGLANIYYDFDTRSRFTPYLGVGLGFAHNTTKAGTVAITGCDAVDVNGNPTCSAAFDGASKTNAAGALMAGFSAKLGDRFSLDAGYRFLYLGDAHTGDIMITRAATTTTVTGSGPSSTPDPVIRDVYAHQLRVGVRMDLR